ncbi:MAG: hypothetical protein V1858_01935 [Candidatus Gottesmanbacteria bacterium]
MKKIIIVVILLITTLFIFTSPVLAEIEVNSSAVLPMIKRDYRINQLRKYLVSLDSPLSSYSAIFVRTADKYDLDWKLIPAISGVESTFGKAIPPGSYNAYGWANGAYYFDSWEDSIEIVAKTLRENYFNRGADTVDKIAPIYAPPSTTWNWKVKFFMEKIAGFTISDTSDLELSL